MSTQLAFDGSLLERRRLRSQGYGALYSLLRREGRPRGNIVVRSSLLLGCLRGGCPKLCLISSAAGMLASFDSFLQRASERRFRCVIPSFHLGGGFRRLGGVGTRRGTGIRFLYGRYY